MYQTIKNIAEKAYEMAEALYRPAMALTATALFAVTGCIGSQTQARVEAPKKEPEKPLEMVNPRMDMLRLEILYQGVKKAQEDSQGTLGITRKVEQAMQGLPSYDADFLKPDDMFDLESSMLEQKAKKE